MTFPVDAARATTDGPDGPTVAVNLPGGITAGDILYVVIRIPNAAISITFPNGWIKQTELSGDGNDRTAIGYRIADGTEGSTATFTFSSNIFSAAIVWRITGGDVPTYADLVTGSSVNPDSPSHTPVGGAQDTLWLTIGGCEDNIWTITDIPSGYSNSVSVVITGGGGSNAVMVFGASKQANAATEDPGAWTLSGLAPWAAGTIAIPPVQISTASFITSRLGRGAA